MLLLLPPVRIYIYIFFFWLRQVQQAAAAVAAATAAVIDIALSTLKSRRRFYAFYKFSNHTHTRAELLQN